MAITKDKKKELLKQYVENLKNAGSVYVINQNAIPVEVSTKVRKEMKSNDAVMSVVRKRLFLRAVKEAGLEDVSISDLNGAPVAIFAKAEDYSPLKTIVKYNKEFKLNKKDSSVFGFLGGWNDKKWQDSASITELANIPSREELLSKLLYLLNYPVQSLACVVDQIAKKTS